MNGFFLVGLFHEFSYYCTSWIEFRVFRKFDDKKKYDKGLWTDFFLVGLFYEFSYNWTELNRIQGVRKFDDQKNLMKGYERIFF